MAAGPAQQTFFLKYAEPELATVSLAMRNVFNHPHKEAIERLYQRNIDMDFTSLNGGNSNRVGWQAIEKNFVEIMINLDTLYNTMRY